MDIVELSMSDLTTQFVSYVQKHRIIIDKTNPVIKRVLSLGKKIQFENSLNDTAWNSAVSFNIV